MYEHVCSMGWTKDQTVVTVSLYCNSFIFLSLLFLPVSFIRLVQLYWDWAYLIMIILRKVKFYRFVFITVVHFTWRVFFLLQNFCKLTCSVIFWSKCVAVKRRPIYGHQLKHILDLHSWATKKPEEAYQTLHGFSCCTYVSPFFLLHIF